MVPAFKLGSRWKFRKAVLDRWMERKMRQARFEEAALAARGRRGVQAAKKGEPMFGKRKTKAVVGLDIGSSSIKAVELKAAKQGYELVSFGLEPLAQDTVVDGAIMDAPLVAGAIGTIFDRQNDQDQAVATAVSGHSVIVKRVIAAR